jgi:hypothetical protein
MAMLRMSMVCYASAENLLCMIPDAAAKETQVAAQDHRLFSAGVPPLHLMGTTAVLQVP